jgi:hypothetical protein
MVATSVALRPTRSPKWPNRKAPTGRARKAMPKVRKGVERLRLRRRLGKERLADHQRRRGAIDIEIVEFDRRADQARQHNSTNADLRRPPFDHLRHRFPPYQAFFIGLARLRRPN